MSYAGFKNSDHAGMIDTPVTVSTVANINSAVGTYVLVPGGGLDNNYSFSYVDGLLTVHAIPEVVVVQNNSLDLPPTVNNALNNPYIYHGPVTRPEELPAYKQAPEYVFVNDKKLFDGTYVIGDALIVISESLQDWVE